MPGEDHHIQISDDATVIGSQIASGREVRQIQRIKWGGDASELEQALNRVAELLERHRDQIPESHRARRDLEDIRQEVTEAEPDRERVSHALQRLSVRVAGVTVLAQAVADLAALLTGA